MMVIIFKQYDDDSFQAKWQWLPISRITMNIFKQNDGDHLQAEEWQWSSSSSMNRWWSSSSKKTMIIIFKQKNNHDDHFQAAGGSGEVSLGIHCWFPPPRFPAAYFCICVWCDTQILTFYTQVLLIWFDFWQFFWEVKCCEVWRGN